MQRPPTHAIRLAFDSTASAVEFYIILHKILTETVYYNHNYRILKSADKKNEIEKSRFFSRKLSLKFQLKFFDLKNFRKFSI